MSYSQGSLPLLSLQWMESLGILYERSHGPSSLFRPAPQGKCLAYHMGAHPSPWSALWELEGMGWSQSSVFSEFQEGKGIRQGGSRGGEELDSSVGLAGFFSLAPPLVAKGRCPHLKIGVTTYSLSESVVKVNGS